MDAISQKKSESVTQELLLPQDKDNLTNAFVILKEGLNKANKSKLIDLQTATALRDTMRNLNDIILSVIKAYYKDDKLLMAPIAKVCIPEKIRLESMLKMIYHAIDKAQINGAYDTIDESGNLYDSLNVIGTLIGSMINYINIKEQNEKTSDSTMLAQTN